MNIEKEMLGELHSTANDSYQHVEIHVNQTHIQLPTSQNYTQNQTRGTFQQGDPYNLDCGGKNSWTDTRANIEHIWRN